jgi:glycosyltransferase involved in cell wall biosynthesis
VHIVFLTENFPPEVNAAATRVFERATYWQRWGHQVTVVTCAPNFPSGRVFEGYRNRWCQIEEIAGMRVVRVKTYIAPNEGVVLRSLDFLSFLVTGFWAGVFQRRPDIVVATSPQFFAAVAGWAVGLARRRPFIFELGDLWPNSIVAVGAMRPGLVLRLLERLELFLYRRSAAVVALTESFKRNLVGRGIPADKIAVVINGVDLPRYSPRPRDAEFAERWGLTGKFVVGYVGTLGMAHGLTNVLDAAQSLGDADIRFLLVGPGAERELLINEVARRGLRNVVIAPPQPKDTMPRIWSLCDVALIHLKDSPAFAEVIPSKMFEAMAMGLPLLLVAPRGEASRIVEREQAGLVVPAADPAAFAEAVKTLARDEAGRRGLAQNALQAAGRYSRERQAVDMMKVLDAVVNRGASAAAAL